LGPVWSPPFDGPHRLAVDHHAVEVHPARLAQPVQEPVVQLGPDPQARPLGEAAPAGRAADVEGLARQRLPGDAGLQHEQDAPQRVAVAHRRAAALARRRRARRQQRLDLLPELVGEQVLCHRSLLASPLRK
jgi:hypothetical protein